ncbi:MAG: carbohydrate ABC transporter permease [Spirochaetia bacterium]
MRVTESRLRNTGAWLFKYLLILIFVLFAVGPLFWQVSASLRHESEYYRGLTLFPENWTLINYEKSLEKTDILVYFWNSIKVTVLTTFFSILIASLGAYSLSRFDYPGKKLISRSVLLVYMFPPILFVVPIFLIIYRMGLLDTHTGLILSYTTFSLPFAMMMLLSYFETIPKELDESGRMDGALNSTIYFRIILPLSMPGIATVAIFSSITAWNEFLYALIFITSELKKTISAGLYLLMMGDMMIDWGMMMALATIVQIPMLIFFIVYGKGLVRGLTAGAIKG